MQRHINMDGLTSKVFSANYRHPDQGYFATIQNNTTQALTITVTNQNILANTTANYDAPASGALVIAAGAIGQLNEPYVGWTLTLALVGSAGETIDIVEAG